MGLDWIIDGKINLSSACKSADWHAATAIDALVSQGIARRDADCYVQFAFSERAEDDEDDEAESWVDDGQHARLTVL